MVSPNIDLTLWGSFDELFERELDLVFGFLRARCGSESLAEDLTSETFISALKTWQSGAPDQVTPQWLLTVARRRLVDHWRTADAQRRRLTRLEAERVGPEPLLSHEMSDDRVLKALASISHRHRVALCLRYLDDMSVAQVADVMDINYAVAESLLARARRSFERAFEELS